MNSLIDVSYHIDQQNVLDIIRWPEHHGRDTKAKGGARNHGRDGSMRFDDNGGGSRNREPNSDDGPAQIGEAPDLGCAVTGATGTDAPVLHAEDDDFGQAGASCRVMSRDERLAAAVAARRP